MSGTVAKKKKVKKTRSEKKDRADKVFIFGKTTASPPVDDTVASLFSGTSPLPAAGGSSASNAIAPSLTPAPSANEPSDIDDVSDEEDYERNLDWMGAAFGLGAGEMESQAKAEIQATAAENSIRQPNKKERRHADKLNHLSNIPLEDCTVVRILNLPLKCKKKQIMNALSDFETIVTVKLVPDMKTQKLTNALVFFGSQNAAVAATTKSGIEVKGNIIKMKLEKEWNSKQDQAATRMVMVSNLPTNVSTDALKDHFSKCGDISGVDIENITNKKAGKNKTIAYILFDTSSAVGSANSLHKSQFHEQTIRVAPSQNWRQLDRMTRAAGEGESMSGKHVTAPPKEKMNRAARRAALQRAPRSGETDGIAKKKSSKKRKRKRDSSEQTSDANTAPVNAQKKK